MSIATPPPARPASARGAHAREDSGLAPVAVPFANALRFWLHLGLVSFGGPAGQIALLHDELVEKRRWISERRFLHALNYCMVLPGPEAMQLATYIGWLMHRVPGGLAAGGLFILPSLVLLIGLSWLYLAWGTVPLVAGLFYGVKPAVTAIVLQAAQRIGRRTLHSRPLIVIALVAFLAIFAFNLPFPLIIAAAALAGWLGGRWQPQAFAGGGGHGAGPVIHRPALIDDDTPPPAHAQPSRARLIRAVGWAVLAWGGPMLILAMCTGPTSVLTGLAWFFSKAALLTFGGAYAVLPYVWQGAVAQFAWLTPGQMMDGLALGETTPGPLIIVVAFVGFVTGYGHAPPGADLRFFAGALAACVVTWFTFLPSFVFVLAGGPWVEAGRATQRLLAPLSAITAAVVGVIVQLALFFAGHVLFPHGLQQAPDLAAALLTGAAALALLHYRQSVPRVILGCGAAGILLQLSR